MKTTELVETLLRDRVAELGFTLCDVEFQKEYGNWTLTLFIDRQGGVTIDDCELVSRAVSTKSMRDEDSARMIDIVNDGLVFDLWFIYKWGNLINAVTGTLGAGTNNFSSAYASLEAKTNEEIAKTFESLK